MRERKAFPVGWPHPWCAWGLLVSPRKPLRPRHTGPPVLLGGQTVMSHSTPQQRLGEQGGCAAWLGGGVILVCAVREPSTKNGAWLALQSSLNRQQLRLSCRRSCPSEAASLHPGGPTLELWFPDSSPRLSGDRSTDVICNRCLYLAAPLCPRIN